MPQSQAASSYMSALLLQAPLCQHKAPCKIISSQSHRFSWFPENSTNEAQSTKGESVQLLKQKEQRDPR